MDFLMVDLPAGRSKIFENEDVILEWSVKADTSASYIYTAVGRRKKDDIELEPGFTKIFVPTKKVTIIQS